MSNVANSADGVPVHYETQGSGSPALVFVHGWSCDRGYWSAQTGEFARRHLVVAIDLAGHGESGPGRKDWTMAAFGEDVVAVVRQLKLDRVVLVGHSMGGPVIVEAARRMPGRVAGLVGVDTFRDVEHTFTAQQIDEMMAPFRANFVEAARQFVREMFVANSDPALVEQVANDMAAAPARIGISAMRNARGNAQAQREGLREIKSPIVAINSDYRPNNVEGARRHGIEMMLMSGVGHFVMMEDAATFNRLLWEALKRFAPAAARTRAAS